MLTPESVLALAPDDASAKAARGLVAATKWPTLGADEAAVWGECQGSGSKPYQAQVDLSGPSFRCSCPSRKFPCKHGLALLLLKVQDPGRFSAPRPAWVDEWLAARVEKAQKKEEREAQKAAAPPPDPQAAAKRGAQRWARIEGAALDLSRWMADQLARGLGAIEHTKDWQTMAARMVDAQAPGLGQRLIDTAATVRQGHDWPERCLHRLGLLQLACEGLQRRARLPEAVQADLRTVVGWPVDKDDVVAHGDLVEDRWTVLGVVHDERDAKLVERRVWLQGQRSGEQLWLLDHAFGGRGFETSWMSGTSVDASLHRFPGAARLRALCATAPVISDAPAVWPLENLEQAWDRITRRVAASPWVWLHPLVLRDAVPSFDAEGWTLRAQGRRLPMHVGEEDGWLLLAIGAGQPLQVAGEWDGDVFTILTAWRDDDPRPAWIRAA